MKYWITKYALTEGIVHEECDESLLDHGRVFPVGSMNSIEVGREAFEHHADAIAAACLMRDKKIKSLEKQIAKLKAMTFDD